MMISLISKCPNKIKPSIPLKRHAHLIINISGEQSCLQTQGDSDVECIGDANILSQQCHSPDNSSRTCNYYPEDAYRNYYLYGFYNYFANRSHMDVCEDKRYLCIQGVSNWHARTPAFCKAQSFLQIRCGNFQNGFFRP